MAEPSHRPHRAHIRPVPLGTITLGGRSPLFLIAGPCVVEDRSICMEIARQAQSICACHGVSFIFKASYDKPNKTIKGSYRGPGWKEGLDRLQRIKAETGVPILTDVHEREQCAAAAEVADILQIPALLSKQIDLILSAAETGRVVNIKKGQFTAPWEARNVVARLADHGFHHVLLTERGCMFGYQTLISDMRSLQILSCLGVPVVFDASHSVHGHDLINTGSPFKHRDYIRPLVRSAVANGVDGMFVETHPDPDNAQSDSPGTLALSDLEQLVKEMVAVDLAVSEVSR